MAQRRKKRTSIRTAAGVAQEKFLDRVREAVDDPLRLLPVCTGEEPKPIAKLRAGLERAAAGKPSFFDKRDKGIVGAVYHSRAIAQLEAVPRLIDTKIGGKRRFFLTRGHVSRAAMLGVHNHDEPRALLMAYRDMAKLHGLHFFAGSKVWCTGPTPTPPEAWLDELATEVNAPLRPVEGGYALGEAKGAYVRLDFRGGPSLRIYPGPGMGNVHKAVSARYAGPRQRHPVEVVVVLPNGEQTEPSRDALASYRGGIMDERALSDSSVAAWRTEHGKAGRRYVLGDRDLGEDQEAFLAAVKHEAWEEPALRAITADGFVGKARHGADVFDALEGKLGIAIATMLPADACRRLLAARGRMPAHDVVRKAHEQAELARVDRLLPAVSGGAEVQCIDAIARGRLLRGRAGALDAVRKALDAAKVPPGHIAAFLAALDGDVALSSRLDEDATSAGLVLKDAAQAVLDAQGEDYVQAVNDFLRAAGVSEKAS